MLNFKSTKKKLQLKTKYQVQKDQEQEQTLNLNEINLNLELNSFEEESKDEFYKTNNNLGVEQLCNSHLNKSVQEIQIKTNLFSIVNNPMNENNSKEIVDTAVTNSQALAENLQNTANNKDQNDNIVINSSLTLNNIQSKTKEKTESKINTSEPKNNVDLSSLPLVKEINGMLEECLDTPSSNGESSFQQYKSLNSSLKLSENPFDLLSNVVYKQGHKAITKTEYRKSLTTDDQILSCLKKQKTVIFDKKVEKRYGLFSKLQFLSKTEMNIPCKKYYKFPFDLNVLNDGSGVFNLFKNEFFCAMSSVYSNYRRFSEPFRVLLQDELFDFSKTLKCTKGLSRLLTVNDISFEETDYFLIVNSKDVGIVYDIILNYEILPNKAIPFILSEYEFENGIVFRTKFKKEAVVKLKESFEYSYVLYGPVFTEDVFFDDDVQVKYC